MTRLQRPPGPA